MFEIPEQLILEQSDGIFGVSQINWERSPWKQLFLVNDEEVISLSHAKFLCILRFCVMSWKYLIRSQHQILLGNDSWIGSKIHHKTDFWTRLTENRWNSSGIFSQDSLHCSSSKKSNSSCTKWENPNNSEDELSSCRCSMTSCGEVQTMKRNVLLIPHLCLYSQKRFPAGRWSFFGPGSEIKWFSTYSERPGGERDKVAALMMTIFGESGHLVF